MSEVTTDTNIHQGADEIQFVGKRKNISIEKGGEIRATD